MSDTIVEWAPIRLAAGRTEADLLAASRTFQTDFLARQPGFLRRELVRKAEGEYVDIVHWRSEADARAILGRLDAPACQAFFSVMQMSEAEGAACVDHFVSLAVYE